MILIEDLSSLAIKTIEILTTQVTSMIKRTKSLCSIRNQIRVVTPNKTVTYLKSPITVNHIICMRLRRIRSIWKVLSTPKLDLLWLTALMIKWRHNLTNHLTTSKETKKFLKLIKLIAFIWKKMKIWVRVKHLFFKRILRLANFLHKKVENQERAVRCKINSGITVSWRKIPHLNNLIETPKRLSNYSHKSSCKLKKRRKRGWRRRWTNYRQAKTYFQLQML